MTKTPAPSGPSSHTRRARIVAITSGKGGVGKTFLSANLAAGLARLGRRVLVLDADLGLANLDVVLNLFPKITLHDVFTGQSSLDDAVLAAPGGFDVVLAGSGMVEYSRLTNDLREQLLGVIDTLAPRYDDILLDTGAGISDVVLYTISLAQDVLVVATPEPTSLADAYATIKVLVSQQGREQVGVVVNQVHRAGEGRKICQQLQGVLSRFVPQAFRTPDQAELLHLVGELPHDEAVREAVQSRQLLLVVQPGCPASLALMKLARHLEARWSATATPVRQNS